MWCVFRRVSGSSGGRDGEGKGQFIYTRQGKGYVLWFECVVCSGVVCSGVVCVVFRCGVLCVVCVQVCSVCCV